jgi:hypothetical protein
MKWISVDDKLPHYGEVVWIKYYHVLGSEIRTDLGFIDQVGVMYIIPIYKGHPKILDALYQFTHWMPISVPPKKENNNE